MKNKCLCRSCENQDNNGYCDKLQDNCTMKCVITGDNCNGMTVCGFYESNKMED